MTSTDEPAPAETVHDTSLDGAERECPYDHQTKILQVIEREDQEQV
jgi:hypothetical protein